MRYKSLVVCFISLLMLAGLLMPASAQDLTPSPWYAVLYTQLGDQLVWLNLNGVQATINRPHLPNEMQGPKGSHDMRISPNGRYGVFSATLNDGLSGLGIYDFQKAAFVQVHTAQPGEIIVLGSRYIFMPDSTGVAVSFYTLGNQGAVSDWRIIQFDLATGGATGVLTKSDQAFKEPAIGAGAYPYVFYALGKSQVFAYHFYMIPYAVGGGSEFEALGWAPAGNAVISLGTLNGDFDVQQATDNFIESGFEVGLPAVTLDGPIPIYNIITQRNALNVAPQTILSDGTASLFAPHWANSGLWLTYQAVSPNETYWIVRTLSGDMIYTYSDLVPTEILGTPDGILLNYEGQTFIASTTVDATNAPVLFEAPPNDEARVVYITPQSGGFVLTGLGTGETVQAAPKLKPHATCQGAPESQMGSDVPGGLPVRVTYTDGTSVRLRQEPNGKIITELPEGTPFTLIDGPVCLNSYLWWKASVAIEGSITTGWVAEGNMESYFIEVWYSDGDEGLGVTIGTPFNGVIGGLLTPTLPPAVAVTAVPTLMIINTNFITDGDCKSAPTQTIAVGNTVATQGSGSLSMRDTPTAELPITTVASGTQGTVQEGPLCHKGFRMWKVAFSTGQTGWVADGFGSNVYLVKK